MFTYIFENVGFNLTIDGVSDPSQVKSEVLETSELYKAQRMMGKCAHNVVNDTCTDIRTQMRAFGTALGMKKNEVNHCPAAQQWAGLHSVNSANVCLCGISVNVSPPGRFHAPSCVLFLRFWSSRFIIQIQAPARAEYHRKETDRCLTKNWPYSCILPSCNLVPLLRQTPIIRGPSYSPHLTTRSIRLRS